MEDFWQLYHQDILFLGFVLVATVFLLWLTNWSYRFFTKRLEKKYNYESLSSLRNVKKILNLLWLITGLASISFVFVSAKTTTILKENLQLIVYVGVVLVVSILTATMVQLFFSKRIQEKTAQGADSTSLHFIQYLASIGVYLVGILLIILAFPSLKHIAGTVLGGAGILAVVLGIASQEALANLVSGLFIISFKPFKIGDIIQITDTMMGTVHDITLRHTVIQDFQNKMIVIPNSIINKERLINYDLSNSLVRQWIFMRIAYESDIDLARKIMREECVKHPFTLDNRTPLEKANNEPVVPVKVVELQESAVLMRAWVWTSNYADSFDLKCDLLESIKKRFDAEGISIPYPHRTMVYKNAPQLDPDHKPQGL